MPSLAVRVHKMPGMRTVRPAAVVGLRLHDRPRLSVVSLTAHDSLCGDSGWGP
ncbi:hypothetical protein ACGF13_12445 [Kitasatospora sp. NPDC048286]|uniref:hypothetical protein n=1 Tax=unclassified Kitasatospora TaxID=2633591 RepID=UPI00371F579A